MSKQRGCQAGLSEQQPPGSHTQLYHHPLPTFSHCSSFYCWAALCRMEYPSVQRGSAAPAVFPIQPLAQPQPTLWGGGWAEQGEEDQVPKLEGNKLTPVFSLALRKKVWCQEELQESKPNPPLSHGYSCSYSTLSRLCKQNTKPNIQNPIN